MADLYCTVCGEPWDLDYVLHGDDEDLKYAHGRISSCPCCPRSKNGKPPRKIGAAEKKRAEMAAMLAEVLGDDVDGIAIEGDEMDTL